MTNHNTTLNLSPSERQLFWKQLGQPEREDITPREASQFLALSSGQDSDQYLLVLRQKLGLFIVAQQNEPLGKKGMGSVASASLPGNLDADSSSGLVDLFGGEFKLYEEHLNDMGLHFTQKDFNFFWSVLGQSPGEVTREKMVRFFSLFEELKFSYIKKKKGFLENQEKRLTAYKFYSLFQLYVSRNEKFSLDLISPEMQFSLKNSYSSQGDVYTAWQAVQWFKDLPDNHPDVIHINNPNLPAKKFLVMSLDFLNAYMLICLENGIFQYITVNETKASPLFLKIKQKLNRGRQVKKFIKLTGVTKLSISTPRFWSILFDGNRLGFQSASSSPKVETHEWTHTTQYQSSKIKGFIKTNASEVVQTWDVTEGAVDVSEIETRSSVDHEILELRGEDSSRKQNLSSKQQESYVQKMTTPYNESKWTLDGDDLLVLHGEERGMFWDVLDESPRKIGFTDLNHYLRSALQENDDVNKVKRSPSSSLIFTSLKYKILNSLQKYWAVYATEKDLAEEIHIPDEVAHFRSEGKAYTFEMAIQWFEDFPSISPQVLLIDAAEQGTLKLLVLKSKVAHEFMLLTVLDGQFAYMSVKKGDPHRVDLYKQLKLIHSKSRKRPMEGLSLRKKLSFNSLNTETIFFDGKRITVAKNPRKGKQGGYTHRTAFHSSEVEGFEVRAPSRKLQTGNLKGVSPQEWLSKQEFDHRNMFDLDGVRYHVYLSNDPSFPLIYLLWIQGDDVLGKHLPRTLKFLSDVRRRVSQAMHFEMLSHLRNPEKYPLSSYGKLQIRDKSKDLEVFNSFNKIGVAELPNSGKILFKGQTLEVVGRGLDSSIKLSLPSLQREYTEEDFVKWFQELPEDHPEIFYLGERKLIFLKDKNYESSLFLLIGVEDGKMVTVMRKADRIKQLVSQTITYAYITELGQFAGKHKKQIPLHVMGIEDEESDLCRKYNNLYLV